MKLTWNPNSHQTSDMNNPFECPLCMEYYDNVHIPTTFSCGHRFLPYVIE